MPHRVVLKINSPGYAARLRPHVTLHEGHAGYDAITEAERAEVRVLVTAGVAGARAADMDPFPNLGLICCVGTGYENVDLDAARARGIMVTHGAGTNAGAVADQAMGLLIAIVRRIPQQDVLTRAGGWRHAEPPRPIVSTKKIGIYGMGGIGEALARRAAAFDMEVFYHSRTAKPHLPWTYLPSLSALAAEVDFLVACVPGGAETFHAIDAGVLAGLGPQGYVVNVGRGSIVDTAALIAALEAGTIAGAALDVYETEPDVPEALRRLENVVLTPHTAGVAPELQDMATALLLRNVEAFLEGRAVITPVPPMRTAAAAE